MKYGGKRMTPDARTHLVCRTCATRYHDTDQDRAHEVLTASAIEAELFRLAHAGHGDGVREVAVG